MLLDADSDASKLHTAGKSGKCRLTNLAADHSALSCGLQSDVGGHTGIHVPPR
jgi:hypothetical protein